MYVRNAAFKCHFIAPNITTNIVKQFYRYRINRQILAAAAHLKHASIHAHVMIQNIFQFWVVTEPRDYNIDRMLN